MATDLLAWRGRNDNGDQATATWKANQGVAWTQATNVNFRVRFLHQQSAALVNNLNCQFQYSLNNVDWVDVTGSSVVVRSSASANVADGATTTSQLTGGSGTYIGATCFDEVDGNVGGTSLDVTSTGNFETEYCCQLRDADVFKYDVIYLRDWNSDTGAAWTTQTGGVASITADASRARIAPTADNWANLGDTAPTIDKQALITPKTAAPAADDWGTLADSVIAGIPRQGWADSTNFDRQVVSATTPIDVPVPADGWANLADAQPTLDLRGFKTAAPTADPWANLADTTPTIDERGFKTAAPSADPWSNLGDVAPTIDERGFKTAIPAADPWANLADATPTILERGFLTAAPAADGWANLGDTAPTILKTDLKTITPGADAWLTLDDQAPTIDRQVVSTTPKTAAPAADDWANLADQAPTTSRFGFISLVPSADSLNLWNDAPTVDERGFIIAAPGADPWLNLADQSPTIVERGFITATLSADSLNNWSDDRTVTKADLGTTPINVTLTADSLDNWADTPASERRRMAWADSVTVDLEMVDRVGGNLTDALPVYADSLAGQFNLLVGRAVYLVDGEGNFIVDENGNLIVIDGLVDSYQLADSVAKDLQYLGVTPKTATPPADAWGTLTDQAPTAFERYAATPAADSLGSYNDQAPTVFKTGALTAAPSADAWNNLADTAPTVQKTANLTAAPAADSLGLYTDYQPTVDRQVILTTPKTAAPPADSLGLYADQTPSTFETYRAALPTDSLGLYVDQARVVRGPLVIPLGLREKRKWRRSRMRKEA